MSRYINVKWLQESLELADECKDCKRNVDKCVYANIDVDVVCNAVDDAPSIDIVRCDECQYYEDGHCESAEMWQSINGNTTECESMSRNADDFCSYGERREP